ncbi:hypothetical protein SAMN04487776_12515 [Priestia megaterium]|nr:hypothetical protein SAMN04487776_12515 [Priestia megaterium]
MDLNVWVTIGIAVFAAIGLILFKKPNKEE